MSLIEEKLDEMIPSPYCELDYKDDFSLLISILLSAQAKDENVNKITPFLFKKYFDAKSMSEANFNEIESIIRPLGLSKTKAKNIIALSKIIEQKYDNKVPSNYGDLIILPGIGNKSAKVFLIEYYKENYFPVDTHVKRVSTRLGLSNDEDSVETVEKKLSNYFEHKNLSKLHQQFVLHGRYTCLAKKPKCENCKLKEVCKFYKKEL